MLEYQILNINFQKVEYYLPLKKYFYITPNAKQMLYKYFYIN